jgi:alkanesulfonate monooxygenase SsuD/methylene tetrahydromethanopterin reductase-like flavin-dependent oxidoreductase (luciferase family)
VRFGVFDHLERIPGTPLPELFRQRLELTKLADQGGITGYHLAEHHGCELCMAPNQESFLSAVAAVTTRLRIGPLVKCLPLHHPLALIQDICILDNLSGGRLDYGVGRGVAPSEHAFFGHPWQEDRERFEETLDIVVQGLRTGKIDSDGRRFFDFPTIELAMEPAQSPNPPFWYPGEPEAAGARGMAAVTFTRVSAELRQRYLAAWESNKDDPRRVDGPGQHPLIGNAEVMVIAGSAEAAQEIAMRGQAGLGRRIRQAHEYDQRVIPPDELEAALGARRFQQGRRPLDATAPGRQIPAGTVEMVRDNYVAYAGEGNCDYVLLMLPTGDMTHLEAMNSLERFCEDVLPAVSAVGT